MEFSLIYRSKIIIAAYKDWLFASDRVLDIGCGNAVVTEELRKYFHCSIVGTDILDYQRRSIPFKIMTDQSKLPFEDNEFDISMFNDALHHCNDQEGLLNEAFRVANRILIFEMEDTLMAKILDVLINQIHNPKMNTSFNIKTLEQWCSYFKRLNFDFEYRKIKKPSIFYPFRNFAFKVKKSNPNTKIEI